MPAPNFQYSLIPSTDAINLAIRDLTTNWGAPQPDPSEVTSALFYLYPPDPSTKDVSSGAVVVNLLTKGFPVISDVVVTNTDLGVSGSLADGNYSSTTTLIYLSGAAGAGTVSYTVDFQILNGVFCCIGTATAKSCSCSTKKSLELFAANIKLLSIDYACSDAEKAALIASVTEDCQVNKFCKNCN